MKIGVVTYHRAHNYGAFLQAYALTSYIREKYGFDAEIIDIDSRKSHDKYFKDIWAYGVSNILNNYKLFNMFNSSAKMLPLSEASIISDKLEDFYVAVEKGKYDVIITGSDEVWKIGLRGFPNLYWIPEVKKCHKLAYAVSSRKPFAEYDESIQRQIETLLEDFEYIGVRDDSTYNNIKNTIQNQGIIHKNCDPVFLYDFKLEKNKCKSLIEQKFHIDTRKKTIAVMLTNKELSHNVICQLKKEFVNCNIIALYHNLEHISSNPTLNPFEWMKVISGADFLITQYFHGMCFAIKGNTPFYTIECRTEAKGIGKNYDILSEIGLLERFSYKNDSDLFDRLVPIMKRDIESEYDFSDICLNQAEKSKTFFEMLSKLRGIND